MLKKSSIRRITIATIALVIVGLICIFPSKKEEFPQSINYVEADLSPIYLIDSNDYVARTQMIIKENDDLLKVKEIIEALTIGSSKKDYIPNGFKQIIPENTKLIEATIDGGLLKLNFSKEFLNVKENDECKMIESIIYSLTENENIKNIMIYVEGEKLTKLPNSKKKLPELLNRDFGINKVYDLDTFSNTYMTTIYYLSKFKDSYYYVPVSLINNDDSNKIEIVIESLKSSPIYQENLMSYLASSVELLDYEVKESVATLNFNDYVLSDLNSKDILEEVKYTIFLSLKDSMNVKEVNFNVNDVLIENFKL